MSKYLSETSEIYLFFEISLVSDRKLFVIQVSQEMPEASDNGTIRFVVFQPAVETAGYQCLAPLGSEKANE